MFLLSVASAAAVRAAVTIQSLWRGYHARLTDSDVVRARSEMRLRRMEDHVNYLRQQLNEYACFLS